MSTNGSATQHFRLESTSFAGLLSMRTQRRRPVFRLESIAAFDARRGYRRCQLPCVGVTVPDRAKATADLWRSPTGRLVARFYSLGYVYHLQARRADGREVADGEMDEFFDFVSNALFEWVIDGVDDQPDTWCES